MKDDKIKALYATLGEKDPVVADRWIRGSCPLAWSRHKSGKDSNPSFGISRALDGGFSTAHCLGCGFTGRLEKLLGEIQYEAQFLPPKVQFDLKLAWQLVESESDDLEFTGLPDFEQEPEVKQVVPWPEDWLKSFMPVTKSPRAMAYLTGRGVGEHQIKVQELRYDSMRDRVCFPFRSRDGKLAGMRGRAVDPANPLKFYDYTWSGHNNSELMWYGEHLCDFHGVIVLVEGQSDWGRVHEAYPNVLAGLTASLTQHRLKKLVFAEKVVGLFDNRKIDPAGGAASDKVSDFLATVNVPYVEVDYDVFGIHGGDPLVKDPDLLAVPVLRAGLEGYVGSAVDLPAWDDLPPW